MDGRGCDCELKVSAVGCQERKWKKRLRADI